MPATGTLQSITLDAADLNGRGRGHGPLLYKNRARIYGVRRRAFRLWCYANHAHYAAPRTAIGRVRHEPKFGQDQKSLRPARPALRIILISHFGQLGVT